MTTTTITADQIRARLVEDYCGQKRVSAWTRGVYIYAHDLLDDLEVEDIPTNSAKMEELFLNGASSWSEYSWGGCSLINDGDIALRLCTPSELRKTRDGERRPNSTEDWLDVQARALSQAYRIIRRAARIISR